jgi:hypothetical protein
MKKWLVVVVIGIVLSLGSLLAVAEGGKNHGDVGTGTVVVGTDAQGAAEQPRAGR